MHGAFWAGQRKVILSLTVRPGQPAGGQQEQRKDEPGVQQPRVSKPPPKASPLTTPSSIEIQSVWAEVFDHPPQRCESEGRLRGIEEFEEVPPAIETGSVD